VGPGARPATPIEAIDHARRRDLTPIRTPEARRAKPEPEPVNAETREAPPGDPEKMAGVPIVSRETARYRNKEGLPHVAGLERVYLELERRWTTNGNGKLATALAAVKTSASSPQTTALRRRAEEAIDLRTNGSVGETEALDLLTAVVWPRNGDPDYAVIVERHVPEEASPAALEAFLGETDLFERYPIVPADVLRLALRSWCAERGLVSPPKQRLGRQLSRFGIVGRTCVHEGRSSRGYVQVA
jgi:hypothetical protein